MQTDLSVLPTFDTLSDRLAWDHDRLDELLADAAQAVAVGDQDRACASFTAFDSGLRRHIQLEEDILFRLFEARTRSMHGPTLVMRMEHRQIERILDRLGEAVWAADSARFKAEHESLCQIMLPHHMKEENVLYPSTDALLTPVEREIYLSKLFRD